MDYYSHLPGFRRHENGYHVFVADNCEGKLTAMYGAEKIWIRLSIADADVARDDYILASGKIVLVRSARYSKAAGGWIDFTRDELYLLQQFAAGDRLKTVGMLREADRVVREADTRLIIGQAADKLDSLDDVVGMELIRTTCSRLKHENEVNITDRQNGKYH